MATFIKFSLEKRLLTFVAYIIHNLKCFVNWTVTELRVMAILTLESRINEQVVYTQYPIIRNGDQR